MVVESNLQPIVMSTPYIFESCVNTIPVNAVAARFSEIYERCKPSDIEEQEDTTTVEPDDGDDASGSIDELSHSYILV